MTTIEAWNRSKREFIAQNLSSFEKSLNKEQKQVKVTVHKKDVIPFRKMVNEWRISRDAVEVETERKRLALIFEKENPVPTL